MSNEFLTVLLMLCVALQFAGLTAIKRRLARNPGPPALQAKATPVELAMQMVGAIAGLSAVAPIRRPIQALLLNRFESDRIGWDGLTIPALPFSKKEVRDFRTPGRDMASWPGPAMRVRAIG